MVAVVLELACACNAAVVAFDGGAAEVGVTLLVAPTGAMPAHLDIHPERMWRSACGVLTGAGKAVDVELREGS